MRNSRCNRIFASMADKARPKKQFGQHFLTDIRIAERISDSLTGIGKKYDQLLEIGPGEGVMTQFLYENYLAALAIVEIDRDLIPQLQQKFPLLRDRIIESDFLKFPLAEFFSSPVGLIGNFPYNISSQILFKAVSHRDLVAELVGMFQREVARRIVSPPGNKDYGLLSVWVQTFYHCEYLFTVNEGAFRPPPQVKSGVIRLVRNDFSLPESEAQLLLTVIKQAFSTRRKTLRNALSVFDLRSVDEKTLTLRAEQLSHHDFLSLARQIKDSRASS
ncbi:MAG: 16S rRNA (adenine(1518)-N(6)/adenine(1519)-N(6))-dimethyltransferase RsmA [Bacteroidota bacterium]|nr:16S rRNA (adenine(1518)-N(6)/adenine(1519)-N(6))-dimethyltransferase RsmA [Bacteroidota bacterium]